MTQIHSIVEFADRPSIACETICSRKKNERNWDTHIHVVSAPSQFDSFSNQKQTQIQKRNSEQKQIVEKKSNRWWAAEWAEHVTCVHIRLKLHTVFVRHAESKINSNGSLRTRATLHIQQWADTKEGRPTVVLVNSSHIRCPFCVLVSTNVLNGLEFTLRSN